MKTLKILGIAFLLLGTIMACQTESNKTAKRQIVKPSTEAKKPASQTNGAGNKKITPPANVIKESNARKVMPKDAIAAHSFPEPDASLKVINIKEVKYQGEKPNRLVYYEGKPFTGVAETYLGKDRKLSSETFKGGRKNGPYQIWHTNGNPNQRGTIIGEINDGLYREWYKSGGLKYQYHYDMGKKKDAWRSWYENGQPWVLRDFVNDRLHGKIYVWDEDGSLGKEHTYQNGMQTFKKFYFEEN